MHLITSDGTWKQKMTHTRACYNNTGRHAVTQASRREPYMTAQHMTKLDSMGQLRITYDMPQHKIACNSTKSMEQHLTPCHSTIDIPGKLIEIPREQ